MVPIYADAVAYPVHPILIIKRLDHCRVSKRQMKTLSKTMTGAKLAEPHENRKTSHEIVGGDHLPFNNRVPFR